MQLHNFKIFKTSGLALQSFLLTVILLSGCGGGGGGSSGSADAVGVITEKVVDDQFFPVGLAFRPDGSLLFTELATGNVRVVRDGSLTGTVFAQLELPGVEAAGPLGIAIDPDYASNHFVYIYQTVSSPLRNRVLRLTDNNDVGGDPVVIVDNIPFGLHVGGKLAFDREKHLLISGGDAGDPATSQNPATLAGKFLRVNRDGSPVDGNPVLASGFRNVFGIAIHPDSGNIYVSENGPDCDDELNKIVAGGNYGWRPGQPCGDSDPSFIQPIERINPTIGITGAIFYSGDTIPEFDNNLFLGDFNTGSIRRFTLDDSTGQILSGSLLDTGNHGAILDLAESPDGLIYFTASDGIYRVRKP